jgi:hypothetical protein
MASSEGTASPARNPLQLTRANMPPLARYIRKLPLHRPTLSSRRVPATKQWYILYHHNNIIVLTSINTMIDSLRNFYHTSTRACSFLSGEFAIVSLRILSNVRCLLALPSLCAMAKLLYFNLTQYNAVQFPIVCCSTWLKKWSYKSKNIPTLPNF